KITNGLRHACKYCSFEAKAPGDPNSKVVYDHDIYVRMFAESILYHGYALRMVEHDKIRALHRYLNPNVKDVSRYTITKCVKAEHEKYQKLYALTVHFIDDDWKLHTLLMVMGYRKKVFSITLDNASSNVRMVEKLKRDLHSSSPLPLDGKYFHARCCGHNLNLVVQRGLKLIDSSVTKLREIVKYVDSPDIRLTNFEKAKNDCRLECKGKLMLDISTRWNSTSDMIQRAHEVKDAFDLFVTRERDIADVIYENEWDTIQDICDFLEPCYHMTKLFSGSKYPTANLYLYCIVCIEKLLTESHTDLSDAMRKMAAHMSAISRASASRTARGDVDSYLGLSPVVDYDGFDVLDYWKS
ncbi:putative AC transposase, partial [Bienertia sinuspersici]